MGKICSRLPYFLFHSGARFNGLSSRFARFGGLRARTQPDLGLEIGALSMWCQGFGVLAVRPHFHCPPRSIYSFRDKTRKGTGKESCGQGHCGFAGIVFGKHFSALCCF